eukprot:sb/3468358/
MEEKAIKITNIAIVKKTPPPQQNKRKPAAAQPWLLDDSDSEEDGRVMLVEEDDEDHKKKKEDEEEDLPCINMEDESIPPPATAAADSQLRPRLLHGDSQLPKGGSLPKVEGADSLPIVLDEDSLVPLPADHDDSFRFDSLGTQQVGSLDMDSLGATSEPIADSLISFPADSLGADSNQPHPLRDLSGFNSGSGPLSSTIIPDSLDTMPISEKTFDVDSAAQSVMIEETQDPASQTGDDSFLPPDENAVFLDTQGHIRSATVSE